MYFESVAAAFAMDGHGPYVWAAYGITLTILAMLVLLPLLRKRRLMVQLRGELRREHRRNSQPVSSSPLEVS